MSPIVSFLFPLTSECFLYTNWKVLVSLWNIFQKIELLFYNPILSGKLFLNIRRNYVRSLALTVCNGIKNNSFHEWIEILYFSEYNLFRNLQWIYSNQILRLLYNLKM